MITNAPAVEIRNLTIRFGDFTVLDDVSLSIPRGVTTGIIGPNGAGKTTLFHALTGDLHGNGGSVKLNGRPLTRRDPAEVARLGLGKLFQDVRVFPNLSVRENLLVALHKDGERAWNRAWIAGKGLGITTDQQEQVESLLKRIGLVSTALSMGDLVDLPSIARKLKQALDPVSIFLKTRFSKATLTALTDYEASVSPPEPLQTVLVTDLNGIIANQLIYEASRFSECALRPKTQQLLAQKPQGDDLVHCNRLLLEDAYPSEITKHDAVANEPAGSLSYGDQKTLAIGRLLAGQFSTLLLDEPMAGLSPQRADSMCALIEDFVNQSGTTVLLIEHNMQHVRKLCERTIVLNRGKIVADGPTPDVLRDTGVREICLGL